MAQSVIARFPGKVCGVDCCETNYLMKRNSFWSRGVGAGIWDLRGRFLLERTRSARCFSSKRRNGSTSFADGRVNDDPVAGSRIEEAQVLSYLFRSELDGVVKVLVGSSATKYVLHFEVLPSPCLPPDLVLNWGMFRSDPSNLIALKSVDAIVEDLGEQGDSGLFSKPFARNAKGEHTTKLEFDSKRVPFFLSFTIGTLPDCVVSWSEIRTHRKTKFCVPVGIARGSPMPLGMSYSDDGMVNFALFSRNAEIVVLCLFKDVAAEPSLEIALDPYLNRTGDTWHISIPRMKDYVCYGYRCNGSAGHGFDRRNVLLDPYAKHLGFGKRHVLGILGQEPFFDWSGDTHPRIPMEQLVVYRLNVGKFSQDVSSQLADDIAGSFAGVVAKMDHLKKLGVNAILLEPVFTYNETRGPYFPYHFFSPMNKYGPKNDRSLAATYMKNMVKQLHANGIEVFLELAFMHASEGGAAGYRTISLAGIDSSSYYDAKDGTNGVLRCSNPVVQRLILDALQHWAVEYRIDGFCFVNASTLLWDSNSPMLPRPSLVEAIAFDPLLSKVKLIADCFSPLDRSYKEVRFPHWKRWAEMNSRFCFDVRNFLRGKGLISGLATRLCGSGDIFSASRGAAFSFNFVARNFGLPLVDLVSFSNESISSELSWNCGEEGPSGSKDVLDLRLRQSRNFMFILFISLGVPVLNMGDECGLSTGGVSSYSKRGPFNWNTLKTNYAVQTMEFITFLSSLRTRRSDLFQVRNFLKVENIEWYGSDQSPPNWDDPTCNFLAMLLRAPDEGDVFIVTNAGDVSVTVTLPPVRVGYLWTCLVDTSLKYPGFFKKDGDLDRHQSIGLAAYELQPHTCAFFESQESGSGTSGSS